MVSFCIRVYSVDSHMIIFRCQFWPIHVAIVFLFMVCIGAWFVGRSTTVSLSGTVVPMSWVCTSVSCCSWYSFVFLRVNCAKRCQNSNEVWACAHPVGIGVHTVQCVTRWLADLWNIVIVCLSVEEWRLAVIESYLLYFINIVICILFSILILIRRHGYCVLREVVGFL